MDLLGITTVYGDTNLRAQIALHLCLIAEREIPVFAGESMPLSGKDVWLSGAEGEDIEGLDRHLVSTNSGVDFMVGAVNAQPGQVDLMAIGPLTNIARAIDSSIEFTQNIKHLWIMGGDFSESKIEHNFKCDVTAAKKVLESNIPITILDLPSAQKTIIRSKEINRIRNSGKLGPFLYAEIMKWIEPRNQDWTIPHDPIAILGCLQPAYFQLSNFGKVHINPDGVSRWAEHPDGNVQLLLHKEPEKAVEKMIALLNALN